MRQAALIVIAVCLGFSPTVNAQQVLDIQADVAGTDGRQVRVQSPILILDSERMFSESAPGRALMAELERARIDLQAKNDRIVADLEAEELDLTQRRAELEPEAFRTLAEAFDEKAQRTRAERAEELQALNARLDRERRMFLESVAPVLETIMLEAGAAVVLEQREVFINLRVVDITDLAIQRIDASLAEQADAPD